MAVADELRASGAEVSFLGTRERIEAELVPGRRLRDRLPQGARDRPPQPAAGRRARRSRPSARSARRSRALRRRRRRRRPGRRRLRRRAGRAGGDARPHAAGADRGRQPPRPRQPAARGPRAAGLPRLPDRRPRGRALPRHRAARCRPRCCRRPRRRRERFGIAAGRPLPAGDRRQPGRALDQRVRDRGLRRAATGRDFHVVHVAGRRDFDELEPRLAAAPQRERYTLLDYEPDLGDVPRRLRPGARPLRAARSSSWPRPGGRRSSSPTRTPTAGHQTANAAWMAEAGAAR